MRRTPVYHKLNAEYRVVFRHPNHWVAQRNIGSLKGLREYDPWEDLGPPQDTQDKALEIMNLRCPDKPKT